MMTRHHLAALVAAAGIALPAAVSAEAPVRLTDLRPGSQSGVTQLDAAVLDGKLYFKGKDHGAFGADLWVYDGVAPPSKVPGSEEIEPQWLVAFQGAVYFGGGSFSPEDRELWRYDGVSPPAEVLDLEPTGSSSPAFLTVFGDLLCFRGHTEATGAELVCWDGGVASQPEIHDLRPGPNGSIPDALTVIDGVLHFAAFVDGLGSEPWVYSGSGDPTLLADVRPGAPSSSPSDFTLVGDRLYFGAADDGGQFRVWTLDELGMPFVAIPELDVEGGLTEFRGLLLADGISPATGVQQMHSFDGTTLRPLPYAAGAAVAAQEFLEHGNALFFLASGGATPSRDLFRYCGAESVDHVTDAFDGTPYVIADLELFAGRLWFAANEPMTGSELWSLDAWDALLCDGFGSGDTSGWPLP